MIVIYSLLAYNSYLASYGDTQSNHWENAIKYYLKAEELLYKEGLPTKEIALNLAIMENNEKISYLNLRKDRKTYNYWLLNLSSNCFLLFNFRERRN